MGLILLCGLGAMTYRLGHTQRITNGEPSPMLSANDRSRWVSVRALLERGDYQIESYTTDPETGGQWNTIDKVMHLGPDGRQHEFSSKPPLLATLLSVPTWMIHRVTGWNFRDDGFSLIRAVLWCCQLLPLTLTLGYLLHLLVRRGLAPGIILFLAVAGIGGTYVSTFAVSLNNHHFAVLGVYWTLISLLQIHWFSRSGFAWYVVGGLATAFTAANELPALSFCCLFLLFFLVSSPRYFITATLPAAALVGFAALGTNLIAHQSIRPPYAHRSDGAAVLKLPLEIEQDLQNGTFIPLSLRESLNQHSELWQYPLSEATVAETSRFPQPDSIQQRWVLRDYFLYPWSQYHWRALALTRSRDQDYWEVRRWDNWYDYPGSYWHDGARQGVDVGEPDPGYYAFHFLLGHHGLFSLTPIWLLTLPGLALAFRKDRLWAVLAASTLLLSVVVISFYLLRPQLDRNYGGQCSALRWLLWLSPLWLMSMIPSLQWLGSRVWGRWICGILLLASIISASIPAFNPWVHPWLYQWWLEY